MRKESRVTIVVTPEAWVQVKRVTYLVEDDGTETPIGRPHLTSYPPGAALPDDIDQRVRQHAAVAWTPETVTTYRAQEAAFLARYRRRPDPPVVDPTPDPDPAPIDEVRE